jgi:type II secretory pathway component PulC
MGKLGKRQMIILGVMGIVILYAAFNFLVPKKKVSAPNVTHNTAELNTFVTDLTAGLAKDTTKNLQVLIFSRAEKEWRQDPFLDAKSYRSWSKAREPAKVGAAAPKIEFIYSGYLEVNRKRLAIINGMEYREGEELDVKGFVLKSVSPARVVIKNRAARATQTIPMQE